MGEELDVQSEPSHVRTPPNGVQSREEYLAKERAAFLAGEGEADEDGDDPAEPITTATKKPSKKPQRNLEEDDDDAQPDVDDDQDDDDDDDEADEVSTDDEDADESDDDEDEDDDDDEDDEPGKADAQTAKRLAQVRKAELRMRASIAKERETMLAEVSRARADAKEDIDAAREFRALKSRARYDLPSVLDALGFKEDDYEAAARDIYSRSKAAAADPKHREAAKAAQREREHADELAAVRKEVDALKQRDTERETSAKEQERIETLLSGIAKVAKKSDDTPLMGKLVDSNPKRAKALFAEAYIALEDRLGSPPSPKRVARLCEKIRRRELKELGVDPATVAPSAKKTAKTDPKKAGTKTIAGKTTETEDKPVAKSRSELRNSIVAELESGQFD